MRTLALGLSGLWLFIAFGLRLYDMRQPQIFVSALTGGQRHHMATLAWIEGSMPSGVKARGRLVVADVRIDGKIERFASAALPADWADCRLWLEEGPEVVQGVASCPGHAPRRLTAAGTSVAGLGPDNKPGTLYALYPVSSVEPERIVNKVHRHNLAPAHPILLLFGALAMLPLGLLALRTYRRSRSLLRKPTLEGVMEQADKGTVTLRCGERRVAVFVERGEVISVGLGRGGVLGDATMAVDGLRATVQGEVERSDDGTAAFRGQETVRLRPGAVLIVGDAAEEARRWLVRSAGRDAAMALFGVALAAIVSVGLAW